MGMWFYGGGDEMSEHSTPKKPIDEILQYIKVTYRYEPDTGIIYNVLTNYAVGNLENTGKRYVLKMKIIDKKYKCHHVAWFLHYGEWPDKQIDHKDRNNFNNSIDNLHKADDFEQQRNKDNYTGYRGFSILWDAYDRNRSKPWRVRAQTLGVSLGRHESVEVAKKVIDKWCEDNGVKSL